VAGFGRQAAYPIGGYRPVGDVHRTKKNPAGDSKPTRSLCILDRELVRDGQQNLDQRLALCGGRAIHPKNLFQCRRHIHPLNDEADAPPPDDGEAST